MLKNRFFRLLLLSGLLNGILASIIVFQFLTQTPFHPNLPFAPVVEKALEETNFSVLKNLENRQFEELITLLDDTRSVEEGYCVRDLALTVLCGKHFFAIRRALNNTVLQSRHFIQDEKEFLLFAGLGNNEFAKIKTFLKIEQYPFTTEGLFKKLQKEKNEPLLLTFLQTEEFIALETLFRRAEKKIDKSSVNRQDLFELLMEGDFETFKKGYDLLATTGDFSEKSRQKILLFYLQQKSSKAAHLLLQLEYVFALQRLSDEGILLLLKLLDPNLPDAKAFAAEILKSKRSDLVLHAADELCQIPRPGIGQLRPQFREPTPKAPPPRMHVIKEGESLWSIAKKYAVPLDTLVKYNHLQVTTVRPGQTLKLPP